MQTVLVEQRVSDLCQCVYVAYTAPGGAVELLSKDLGGLYVGLQQLYKEYKDFVKNQTELYGKTFPFCPDHLTIVLLESAVHDNRHVQLLKHYLGGNVDQSEEACKLLLSNCPKGCRSKKCFSISPDHDFCSVHCEEQYAAEKAEAERAPAELAEAEHTLAKQDAVEHAPVEQKKKPKLYHIGTGDVLSKSVCFWVNEETIAI